MNLTYAWVRFGGPEENDNVAYKVGEDGVQSITWSADNFLRVIYDDRMMALNLNQARYIEVQEPRP